MHNTKKDTSTLRKILWLDAFLGGSTAIIGLFFLNPLTVLLGLQTLLILEISIVTFLYAVVAFTLANQKSINLPLVTKLVTANWVWTIISIILLFTHFHTATLLGLIFLVLQILVVGALAYWEGKQVRELK